MPPVQRGIDRIVDGVRHPWVTTDEILEAMKTFEVRTDDIWVITYPKAGTTWMQEIVSILYHGCDIQKADEISILKRFLFLDQQKTDVPPHNEAMRMPSPRLIKTHLPPKHMAKQLIIKKPKIVYVGRNPKDNAVSLYNFHRANTYLRTYETWDEFFDAFCADDVIDGSWFDMNIYWWSLRNEENVLFIKYEDMRKDLASVIERVSKFFGWSIPDKKLQDIVKHCTFDSMKKNPKTNFSDCENIDQSLSAFMRKGEVGDWKNYFTKAQNAKFDKLYADRMKGSSLVFEFEL
ncbi:sulfotransferase 1C4-like isoform X2 [Anneissia japonica]|uniref:sulfotransferase 1C4-like isoform X2 n=1 Tax=Anneissia japonica TaxID=1529436 RepID=UPI001425AB4E|nr:sulfotransferase 1C4-like isoform X2 [Anneissia japonica]